MTFGTLSSGCRTEAHRSARALCPGHTVRGRGAVPGRRCAGVHSREAETDGDPRRLHQSRSRESGAGTGGPRAGSASPRNGQPRHPPGPYRGLLPGKQRPEDRASGDAIQSVARRVCRCGTPGAARSRIGSGVRRSFARVAKCPGCSSSAREGASATAAVVFQRHPRMVQATKQATKQATEREGIT